MGKAQRCSRGLIGEVRGWLFPEGGEEGVLHCCDVAQQMARLGSDRARQPDRVRVPYHRRGSCVFTGTVRQYCICMAQGWGRGKGGRRITHCPRLPSGMGEASERRSTRTRKHTRTL